MQDDLIHIWRANLTANHGAEKYYFNTLMPEEQKRAGQFHFPIHRKRYIASRAILRIILSKYINIDPAKIAFGYNKYSKPVLANNSKYQFNLSHSGDMAVYAIAEQRLIGIDIEVNQEQVPLEIAKQYFSELERKSLDNISPAKKNQGFYQIWVRKEAVIKAAGKGLSIPLASFTVSANKSPEIVNADEKTWYLQSLIMPSTHEGSFARDKPINAVSYHDFT